MSQTPISRRKPHLSLRISRNLHAALRSESAKRGLSLSELTAQALERELFGSADVAQLDLLRSVFLVRELVMDMSTRSEAEKEKLWQAMHEHARKVLQSKTAAQSTVWTESPTPPAMAPTYRGRQ